MKYIRTPIILMILFYIPSSYADSMRCGNKLITVGDTKAEVLIKCGEPLTRDTIAIQEDTDYAELAIQYPQLYRRGLIKNKDGVVIGRETTVSQSIDMWTYHLGQGTFLRILYFVGGELAAIEDGDRM